ncbi:MAG TPA: cytochrome c, partial [Polyangiales bacterium]|nr:cytochrome c [Polyangiales bacterium]
MRNHGPSLLLSLLALACACESSNKPTEQKHDMHVDADAGSAPAASEEPAQLTYWKDMVPLFEQHCLSCHREGGIAPFRMDEYSAVKPLAKVIAHATRERTMPPWAVTSDGSCGNFADSIALNEEEIALISAWADSGAAEGEPGSIHVPELPSLDSATEFRTPEFFPEAQGGTLAESDEYRCFAVDKPEDAKGFVTGYEVLPGTAEIVHHVVAFFVDPDRKSTGENGQEVAMTNRERMQ